MIEQSDLLQADARLIAGALIFLTIGTISRGATAQLLEKRWILFSTSIPLAFLIISSVLLLKDPYQKSFDIAQYFFAAGLVGLLITIYMIMIMIKNQ
jgi:hypothetical protein